jgi:hypothetical protein
MVSEGEISNRKQKKSGKGIYSSIRRERGGEKERKREILDNFIYLRERG